MKNSKNMGKRKLWFILVLLLLFGGVVAVLYYKTESNLNTHKFYNHQANYIDLTKALAVEGVKVCDSSQIFEYYNPQQATYNPGKNALSNIVQQNYKASRFDESGYLTFRFIINCEGKAGYYVIHENDLDLIPKRFSAALVKHLTEITMGLQDWNPNFIDGQKRDSYMYISYRIEDGKITEILP